MSCAFSGLFAPANSPKIKSSSKGLIVLDVLGTSTDEIT